jgi:hypothetical protein
MAAFAGRQDGALTHTQPLNLIGPQQHAQHCHSQSQPPPRTPHPSPTRSPSTAPKLAYGSPAAAAARLGVVEVGALESGLRVDLHPSVFFLSSCRCGGDDPTHGSTLTRFDARLSVAMAASSWLW